MSRRLLLRLLAAAPASEHVSDAELLRRFVASDDSAAFELVVRRHAGAVWAACRRLVRSDADAEDAFQATFLALLRVTRDVRSPCVGGWLHRVAVNAALKVRARNARTPTAEPNRLDAVPAPEVEPPDAELAAVVHEELARLSDRERLPVVLCDLEGLTHEAAAAALGWPVGTVSGRLSRARAKLRDRLERRGLTPSGALLPAVAVPPHLVSNALSLPAGAPPAIVSLAEGVLAMTATTTWKWVATAVVCAGLVGAGAAIGLTQPKTDPVPKVPGAPLAPATDQPPGDEWIPPRNVLTAPVRIDDRTKVLPSAFPGLVLPDPDPDDKGGKQRLAQIAEHCPLLTGRTAVAVAPADDALRKVLKARLHQGTIELERRLTAINIGQWTAGEQSALSELLSDMQATATELWGGRPKELIPWLEELVVLTKEFERFTHLRVVTGTAPPQVLNAAARHRLAVEAALLKAKARP